MASTNFLQFDPQQTNMLSDSNYASDTERSSGFVTGISRSILFNKTLFQSSTMSTALANVLVRRGQNAMDNNLSSLEQSIDQAFPKAARGLPIGSIFPTTSPITVAPEGFLLPDGNTFDPVEYADLADVYRIGVDTYKYGQEYINGVWHPKTPDLRGYFLRVHNPQDSVGPDSGRVLGTSQSSENKQHSHTSTMVQAGMHKHLMFADTKIGSGSNLTDPDIQVAKGTTSGNGNYEYTLKQTNYPASLGLTSNAGLHSHELSLGSSGGDEARPNNYALTYLIVAKNEVNLGASSSNYVINNATGTNSLSIIGPGTSSASSINIGNGSTCSENSSIAIGDSAYVTKFGSIQLGPGTNNEEGTLHVGLGYNSSIGGYNYKLLDHLGIIPIARLGATSGDNTKFLRGDGTWVSLGDVLRYKGSVATYSDLPSTGNETGDVWNVLSDGKNYAWDGTTWDDFGGTIIVSLAACTDVSLNSVSSGDILVYNTTNNKWENKPQVTYNSSTKTLEF